MFTKIMWPHMKVREEPRRLAKLPVFLGRRQLENSQALVQLSILRWYRKPNPSKRQAYNTHAHAHTHTRARTLYLFPSLSSSWALSFSLPILVSSFSALTSHSCNINPITICLLKLSKKLEFSTDIFHQDLSLFSQTKSNKIFRDPDWVSYQARKHLASIFVRERK